MLTRAPVTVDWMQDETGNVVRQVSASSIGPTFAYLAARPIHFGRIM